MKSTDKLQLQINDLVAKLVWLQKHAQSSELFQTSSELPHFLIFGNDRNRDAVLTEIGTLLGTDGWTAVQDGRQVNWHKEVDGQTVKIYDAQGQPDQPSSWPVPPTAFPLQLTETMPV